MIYYLVYKVYYNTIKQSYDKIIGFDSKITDNNLINKVKPISIKPIEKVGLTLHSCFYVLKHPTESRFLTVEDLDVALNILLSLNYTVNEILTRIEMKRMKQLVYVLNK